MDMVFHHRNRNPKIIMTQQQGCPSEGPVSIWKRERPCPKLGPFTLNNQQGRRGHLLGLSHCKEMPKAEGLIRKRFCLVYDS